MELTSIANILDSGGLVGGGAKASVTGLAFPDSANVARFDAAMADPEAPPDAVVSANRISSGDEAAGPAGRNNIADLGERVVNQLQKVSVDYERLKSGLGQPGDRDLPSLVEMLRWQASMLQASVNAELIGKCVSRSTQNIDQLTRIS